MLGRRHVKKRWFRRKKRRKILEAALRTMGQMATSGGGVASVQNAAVREHLKDEAGRKYLGTLAGARVIHRIGAPWMKCYVEGPPIYQPGVFRARYIESKTLLTKLGMFLLRYDKNFWSRRNNATKKKVIP